MKNRKMLAVVGFVVIVPALLLCLSGLLGLEPPSLVTHPIAVLGGLALALAVNVLTIAHFDAHLKDGSFVGAVTVNLKNSLMNFSVAALSLMLLTTIMIYLFVENFQPR
jgi:hypothetical protein